MQGGDWPQKYAGQPAGDTDIKEIGRDRCAVEQSAGLEIS
jgi:hypothetical protein